ncbi:acid-sensing ion channel 2-like [Ornithodoros turicata]|uniref:acid-sensing ion channel 2-like n=1 Tax=Ornithodoros turicata TaxID=34597 RepID=UPI00313A20C1
MLDFGDVPGLRIIFSTTRTARRLVWFIVFVGLTSLLFVDLRRVVDDYYEYEDIMSIDSKYDEADMEFPSVTICNKNPVRRSIFCSSKFTCGSEISENFHRKICEENGSTYGDIWLRSGREGKELKSYFRWMRRMQQSKETFGFLLGHQMKDVILGCTRARFLNCNSDKYWTVKSYGTYGNCFCYGCVRAKNIAYEMEHITTPAVGLRILLNVELEEYLPFSNEAGFLVAIHQPGVDVDFSQDVLEIPPRHTTYVAFTQVTVFPALFI